MTEGAGAVYVYGILSPGREEPRAFSGVDGSIVRAVEGGGLAALVSDLRADALTAAREVRAHWRVLEQASEHATVLPVRFGTVLESDDAVRERLLEANADRLAGLLEELAGRVQLGVKGSYDQERLLRVVIADSPAVAALRERVRPLRDASGYYDKIRLGEMIAAQVAQRRERDTALALDRLEPLAVAGREHDPSDPYAAFNLAFLVERDGVDRFSAGVRRLGEEVADRIELRYVGPLPPYSFAEADLTAENGAWA